MSVFSSTQVSLCGHDLCRPHTGRPHGKGAPRWLNEGTCVTWQSDGIVPGLSRATKSKLESKDPKAAGPLAPKVTTAQCGSKCVRTGIMPSGCGGGFSCLLSWGDLVEGAAPPGAVGAEGRMESCSGVLVVTVV